MLQRFRTTKSTESVHESIDLKPFINFLVVLIPVLMLSAEFTRTSVHKLTLNKEGSNQQIQNTTKTLPFENELKLTLLISDSAITVGSNYGFLPSWYYTEYNRYVQKNNRNNIFDVPKKSVENTTINKALYEKSELMLYAKNDSNRSDSAYYYKGKLVLDNTMNPLRSLSTTTDLYSIDNPKLRADNIKKSDLHLQPLSAYDALQCALMRVHERYGSSNVDGNSIVIASDSKVVYDKIIQLIDVSKASGFTDVSITKLRT